MTETDLKVLACFIDGKGHTVPMIGMRLGRTWPSTCNLGVTLRSLFKRRLLEFGLQRDQDDLPYEHYRITEAGRKALQQTPGA